MLTKAEIQSIDFNGNSCQVRIPILETAGVTNLAITTAYFAITPGEFNSYKAGDVVIIGFECNELAKPYVIGKLFTGINTEYENNNQYRGAINCSTLSVEKSASLPAETTIKIEQEAKDSTDDKNNIKTLKNLINTVKQNSNSISTIEREIETLTPNQPEVLLWENPNPTAAFAATTITLLQNYTEFKYIIIFYRYYFGNCAEQCMTFIPTAHNGTVVDDHKQMFINGGNYQNDWASRQIDFSNTTNQLIIYQAQQVVVVKDQQTQMPTGSISVTASNLFCVPTKIYGKNSL